jgi:hypothetical protein
VDAVTEALLAAVKPNDKKIAPLKGHHKSRSDSLPVILAGDAVLRASGDAATIAIVAAAIQQKPKTKRKAKDQGTVTKLNLEPDDLSMKYDLKDMAMSINIIDQLGRAGAAAFSTQEAIAALHSKSIAPPSTEAIRAATRGAMKRQRKQTSKIGTDAIKKATIIKAELFEKVYREKKTGNVTHDAALQLAADDARMWHERKGKKVPLSLSQARRYAKLRGLKGKSRSKKSEK